MPTRSGLESRTMATDTMPAVGPIDARWSDWIDGLTIINTHPE
jgi:hypothetical protein